MAAAAAATAARLALVGLTTVTDMSFDSPFTMLLNYSISFMRFTG